MTDRHPAAPLVAVIALFAMLVTGCVPVGPGVIVDRAHMPPYTTWTTIQVGKVSVPSPVFHSEKWELKLQYDDGKFYWCDVPEAHYNIPNQHIYDCQNQREVVK